MELALTLVDPVNFLIRGRILPCKDSRKACPATVPGFGCVTKKIGSIYLTILYVLCSSILLLLLLSDEFTKESLAAHRNEVIRIEQQQGSDSCCCAVPLAGPWTLPITLMLSRSS